MIDLRLFASLREELQLSHERIELPLGVNTVGAARAFLAGRSERWHHALSRPRLRAALNQQIASDAAEIEEGAELAFFPPVTGG
jgi:molybdopterin synthase sulfur carrier subunit